MEQEDRWRALCRELEEETRKAAEDVREKDSERAKLSSEVRRLRELLDKERSDTEQTVKQYQEKIEKEQRESTRMQMKLMKAQLHGNTQTSEATVVKRDVVDKTNEMLEAMKELREQQQQAFKQVKNLTYAMLRTCSHPTHGGTGSTAGVGSPPGSDVGALILNGVTANLTARSPPRSPASSVARSALLTQSPGVPQRPAFWQGSSPHVADSEAVPHRVQQVNNSPNSVMTSDHGTSQWFQAMKANLEQYGNVEVFINDKPQECMSCCQQILTPYRVRPRRCSHTFHVECLLQWWNEGTCPTCRTSFAPEAPQSVWQSPSADELQMSVSAPPVRPATRPGI